MRALGCLMLLAGGLLGGVNWCCQRRRQAALGQELERQTAVLRREVCVHRRPLGEIAGTFALEGGESGPFWRALQTSLTGESAFFRCWQGALAALPAVYRDILAPLGTALPLGGPEAEALLERTGEDLRRCLRQERESRREREKLAIALAVSAGAMASLALL